uniref:Uncharacterized protein n=1 Tax=Strongyloides stercoralis TaxID=6248 RepID=A0A0K0E0E2_STRER
MASKSESTDPSSLNLGGALSLNDKTLVELLKQQQLPPIRYQYYGETSFSEYIDKNAIFFSKLENLPENEKTANLLDCLGPQVYSFLKLKRPNDPLSKCKYSELVGELLEAYNEKIKFAEEYSKLLFIKEDYCNITDLHRMKLAEWTNLEQKTSQKIPDLVKVMLVFDTYQEPLKSIAEKYIQDHHDKLDINEFISFIESESLFVQVSFQTGANNKKGRSRK